MAVEIRMPQLGLTMEEGTIEKWFKAVGDKVAKDEPIAEISTDKLTNEIESEVDGEILAIIAEEGETIAVQGLLCIIGEPGEKYDSNQTEEKPKEEAIEEVKKEEEPKATETEAS